MLNINKILPWLSIRNKLLIAFVGLSVLPVAFVGIYGIVTNVSMMEEIATENLLHDVHTIREKTGNFISNVEQDIRVLQNSYLLDRFVQSLGGSGGGRIRDSLFNQLTANLLAFARTKGMYYQLRMVDKVGNELFRIEGERWSDSVRTFRVVEPPDLRQSREAYYFLLVNDLGPDQIAFVPAELMRSDDKPVPVISFAMRVAREKSKIDPSEYESVGILIANVFAEDLFHVLEPTRHFGQHGSVVLVSGDGYYLYHSRKKNAWNELLASRQEDNLQHEYPPDIAETLISGNEGVVTARNEIVAYGPLFPSTEHQPYAQTAFGLAIPLFVFESVPTDVIMGPVNSFALMVAGFFVFFFASAIALGLLATRQFTRPIAQLQRGSEIISKGNYKHRLTVKTRDEIEKLAEQFNLMASSLEVHEQEIERHRTQLEEMVQQRTRELMEEKSKLQAILDNVPSAFVLLDKEFRIQTASAAFTAVTGKHLDNVREKDCRAMFCTGGFCHECICEQALRLGVLRSHIDETVDAQGNGRFIEHVAIPMREDSEITSILEIITDVTERKRLEQNLIRTEKLMAAGEMSAIIAHEFRNALTSIKMILQLQHESKRLSRGDKRSLGVALDSLHHMESVVTELLNFGRPSPMNYRLERISNLIEESFALVQLERTKQRIQFVKDVDLSLPPLLLDASRWKEAILNILLNAIQAIRSKDDSEKEETISVAAKRVILQNTLRDFDVGVMDDERSEELPGDSDREIVLLKGTECVLVEISDTGPGIDPAIVGKIFDPFFTTKTNGTGLGLPMVKRTVNAHEGIVTVKSEKGKGTTFGIFVPLPGRNSV